MFKKLFMLLIVLGLFSNWSFVGDGLAYPLSIKILEKKEIAKLTDAALAEAYLDTIIEIEANNLLHKTSGFSPKEYQDYKSLLRYRYELRSELQRRQLDIPVLESSRE